MRVATAEVVEVTGKCNAEYKIGNKIYIAREKSQIMKDLSDEICPWAVASILSNMCRVTDGEEILTSCPDPGTGRGGNVVFRVKTEEESI